MARETAAKTVEAFDQELADLSIEGFWKTIGAMPSEPNPHVDAHLWRWGDVYPKLFEARDHAHHPRGRADGATRRGRPCPSAQRRCVPLCD
jgi:gentisate 1,2-dioxygenase